MQTAPKLHGRYVHVACNFGLPFMSVFWFFFFFFFLLVLPLLRYHLLFWGPGMYSLEHNPYLITDACLLISSPAWSGLRLRLPPPAGAPRPRGGQCVVAAGQLGPPLQTRRQRRVPTVQAGPHLVLQRFGQPVPIPPVSRRRTRPALRGCPHRHML